MGIERKNNSNFDLVRVGRTEVLSIFLEKSSEKTQFSKKIDEMDGSTLYGCFDALQGHQTSIIFSKLSHYK